MLHSSTSGITMSRLHQSGCVTTCNRQKAVNLSLSQLQKQTGQWEISKIPESPFGTVNSELSASDPMLLAGEVWPSPPENLRSRRLHCSVSHQTHNKGGLQRISVQ